MYRFIYGYAAEKPEVMRPTMNLFPVNDKSGDVFGRKINAAPRSLRSMDLFPQHSTGLSPPTVAKVDCLKRVDSSVTSMNKFAPPEPQTAQMTIFYGGQVIVLNDFPADKAKEIILLASQGQGSRPQINNSFNPYPAKTNSIQSGGIITGLPPTSNVVSNFRNNVTQECIQLQPAQQPQPIAGGNPHCLPTIKNALNFYLFHTRFLFVSFFVHYRSAYCKESFTSSVSGEEEG